MTDYRKLFDAITADPRYLANLGWGEARPGHPEGTVRAHIAEIEPNLETLRPKLTDDEYWKLKLLIHTHDSFKGESKAAGHDPGVGGSCEGDAVMSRRRCPAARLRSAATDCSRGAVSGGIARIDFRGEMKRIVLLVVIAGAWGVGAQRPAPPARVTLSVGGPAGAAAIGDFNRDGRNDIAATAGNAVVVFLGDGRGGFERSARSPFGAGENPSDLVLADFNRDGHLDAAVANHETGYLSVLIGDGNGALADPSRVPVPSRPHPHGIAAGDFNADGHPDVAVESWEEDTVLVVHGNGRGTFAAEPVRLAVGLKPYYKLRAGELNADGRDDLVTTNMGGNSVSVVCSGPRGLTQAAMTFPIAPSPFAIAIGDVTGDRIPDLAVAHRWGSLDPKFDGLTVLIGKGACAFAPSSDSPLKVGASPTAVAIGDVDADGIGDIATANMASNDVTVLLARGSGWRAAPGSPFSVGPGPSAIALGDLNGDRRADIVVSTGSDVTILIPPDGW